MEWVQSIAAVATALGVMLAVFQLRQSWKLSQTEFEDSLDQQYRALIFEIPVDVLIGKEIDSHRSRTRELIYNYLDLCNEQIFLRTKKRVRKDTFHDWAKGIKKNLLKIEIQRVWDEVKNESPRTFTFLERLETDQFNTDPYRW